MVPWLEPMRRSNSPPGPFVGRTPEDLEPPVEIGLRDEALVHHLAAADGEGLQHTADLPQDVVDHAALTRGGGSPGADRS